jgi:parvulin-like peptidyl-prolyl isomerase
MLRKLRKKSKIIHWGIIVSFVGTIFAVWGAQYSGRYTEAIAIVNNQPIKRQDFELTYKKYVNIYKRIYGDKFSPDMIPNFKQMIFEQLIRQKLVLPQAKRLGVKITDTEIFQAIRAGFKEDRDYALALRYGLASQLKKLEELAREEVLANKLEQILLSHIKASKKEVLKFYQFACQEAEISQILIKPEELIPKERLKEYYKKNKEDFPKPGDLHLKHILIKVEKPKGIVEEEAEKLEKLTREKIEEIHKRIKEKKEDFEALAKEFSEDTKTKYIGGDLGTLTYENILEEVRDTVYSLKEGDISLPVRSRLGWHIFKLVSRGENKIRDFKEPLVIKAIKATLRDEYKDKAKKLANKIYKELTGTSGSSQVDFATLAKQYSHGTTSYIGGYLGRIPKKYIFSDFPEDRLKLLRDEILQGNRIIEELSDAIFKLASSKKKLKITRPIETPLGFHIIKLHEVYSADIDKFDIHYKELLSYYIEEKKVKIYQDWLTKLKQAAKIQEFIRL